MDKDPVCGMMVDETSSISFEYNGKKYYFCCEKCREEFKKSPEHYLK